jgi:hypothetical protein
MQTPYVGWYETILVFWISFAGQASIAFTSHERIHVDLHERCKSSLYVRWMLLFVFGKFVVFVMRE